MMTDEKDREGREAPRGPIRFHLEHVPTRTLLGTYWSSTEAQSARDRYEASDPEGAAQGHYRITWTFAVPPPKVAPHRFELALLDGTFGPICSECGMPVDLAPHTNREEAWRLMDDF